MVLIVLSHAGPEEDLPRSLDFMEFVCHAPSEYYKALNSPYPVIPSKEQSNFMWSTIIPNKTPSTSQIFGSTWWREGGDVLPLKFVNWILRIIKLRMLFLEIERNLKNVVDMVVPTNSGQSSSKNLKEQEVVMISVRSTVKQETWLFCFGIDWIIYI